MPDVSLYSVWLPDITEAIAIQRARLEANPGKLGPIRGAPQLASLTPYSSSDAKDLNAFGRFLFNDALDDATLATIALAELEFSTSGHDFGVKVECMEHYCQARPPESGLKLCCWFIADGSALPGHRTVALSAVFHP
jgi:hypothetical protein